MVGRNGQQSGPLAAEPFDDPDRGRERTRAGGAPDPRPEHVADSTHPRVLLVDLSRKFGGASARAVGLLAALPADRAALACLDGSPVHEQAARRGLRIFTVGRSKVDPRIVPRLVRIARGGFEVLDTQNAQSQLWASLAAPRAGSALVSTLNSWYEDEHRGAARGRLYQSVVRRTAARTDLFIAVSSAIREHLIAEGTAPESIVLVPNAIALDPASVQADRAWLDARFSLPAGTQVLCSVGRLVEAKGHVHLLEALGSLADPSIVCLLVGDGPLRSELEQRARRIGLGERVRLLGHRDPAEVLRIVKAADLFVLSSTSEGTPIALLEAAALERPIVATTAGGIPEIVADGEHALLAGAGDAVALARAIRACLDDPAAAASRGRRARAHVASRFGVAAQVRSTLAAYDQACARSHRRRSAG